MGNWKAHVSCSVNNGLHLNLEVSCFSLSTCTTRNQPFIIVPQDKLFFSFVSKIPSLFLSFYSLTMIGIDVDLFLFVPLGFVELLGPVGKYFVTKFVKF